MKKIILLLWGITIIFHAAAEEWVFQDHHGFHYLISYSEEGKHYLDLYDQPYGEYQERVFHKYFSSSEKIKKYVDENFNNYIDKKNWKALGLNKILADILPSDLIIPEMVDGEAIWKAENTWNQDWETRYAKWIEENVDKDFLEKNNVAVDCADVAYALRWIFSRIHYLPAANTLAGSEVLLTNESLKEKWRSLKTDPDWRKDERFLAALNYLLDNTYTHTLFKDTYPVKISRDVLISGVIHLSLFDENGHTRVINKVNYVDPEKIPITLISGTTPRMLRTLFEEAFAIRTPIPQELGGFVQIRWPQKSLNQWNLVKATDMPAYSQEQYDGQYMGQETNFSIATYRWLGLDYRPEIILERQLTDLKNMIINRVQIVEDGYRVCQIEDCSEDSVNWENWSTPNRDERVLSTLESIKEFVFILAQDEIIELFKSSLKEYFLSVQDKNYNLEIIEYLWKYGLYSFDPRDPINLRWGNDSQAVSTLMIKKIKEALRERESLIEKQVVSNKCSETKPCEVGDEVWQAYNTYQVDRNFFLISEAVARYRDFFPLKDYEELIDNINKNFPGFHGEDGSIFSFFDLLPFLNSDPRVSVEQRWGGDRRGYHYHRFPHNISSLQVSLNSIALVDGQQVINLLKKREIKFPEKTGLLSQEPHTGITVGIQSGEGESLVIYYPENDKFEIIKLGLQGEGQPYEISWHSESVFSIFRYPELLVYQLDLKALDRAVLIHKFSNIYKKTRVIDLPAESKHCVKLMFNLSDNLEQKYLLMANNEQAVLEKVKTPVENFDNYFTLGTFGTYVVLSKSYSSDDDSNCSIFIDKNTGEMATPFEKNICLQYIWEDLFSVAAFEMVDSNLQWSFWVINDNLEIVEKKILGNYASFYKNDDNLYIYSANYHTWINNAFRFDNAQFFEYLFPDKTIWENRGPLLRLESDDGSNIFIIYNMITDRLVEIPRTQYVVSYPSIPTLSNYQVMGLAYFYGPSWDYFEVESILLNQEERLFNNAIIKYDELMAQQKIPLPIMTTSSALEDSVIYSGNNNATIMLKNGYLLKMTKQGDWFWFSEKGSGK